MRRMESAATRLVVVAVLAVVALGACGRDAETTATASNGSLPAPPVELGPNPLLAGAGDRLFVLGSTPDTQTASAARYDFVEERWSPLPDPPRMRSARAAWSGRELVVVGLTGCEVVRCERAVLTAAVLTADKEWITAPVSSDAVSADELGLDDIGGAQPENGAAYFTLATEVLAIAGDGSVRTSGGLPGDLGYQVCSTRSGLFALAPSTIDAQHPREAALVPTLGNLGVFELPLDFDVDEPWHDHAANTAVTGSDGTVAITAGCGAAGPIAVDGTNAEVHLWEDGAWRSVEAAGGPSPSHAVARLTADGDPILAIGESVLRLQGSDTARSWREAAKPADDATARPLTRKVTVAGDRVIAFEAPIDAPNEGVLRVLAA